MRLSPHFTLTELTKSQTAARRGISNHPNQTQQKNLRALCAHILEPVRAHFGQPIVPSSGFRCAALNQAIGSGRFSQHCFGQAVDFEVPGIANCALADWIDVMLDFDQLILEYPQAVDPHAGWVHVSYKNIGNRNETLTRTQDGYEFGLSPSG